MKRIKIKFVDFSSDFDCHNNDFVNILKKYYDVEISDSPEYLFYSIFGYEHLKFNCIKIFYTGECITPDFNVCDYAIGFDIMNFGDRYCRVPLYYLFQYKADYIKALSRHENADDIISQNRDFCSFVVSNDSGQPQRKEIFELLSKYRTVSSGGRYLNNIGYCVPDKNEFQSHYKFSIAFENCCYPGYTTEKLLQSFSSGTIPIYFGNPKIGEEFNESSFINCHSYNRLEDIVEMVIRIDKDDNLRRKMLSTPIAQKIDDFHLEPFLKSIFDQNLECARRRPVNTRVKKIESNERWIRRIDYFLNPFQRAKNMTRRIRNKALR